MVVSRVGRLSVSHDSGFRPGAQDFTHQAKTKTDRKGRDSDRYDKQRTERFHQHEREAAEAPPAQDETTET